MIVDEIDKDLNKRIEDGIKERKITCVKLSVLNSDSNKWALRKTIIKNEKGFCDIIFGRTFLHFN